MNKNEQEVFYMLYEQIAKEDNSMTEDDVNVIWSIAKQTILNRRYPLQTIPVDSSTGDYLLEDRYMYLCYRISMEIFSKMGAEGEVTHTENGITRQYNTGAITQLLLQEIVPIGKVI